MINVVQRLEQRMDARHQEIQQQLDDMQGIRIDVAGIFLSESPSFDFPCPWH